jgi:predicted AlkP superfamily pyrophosphatase or phosphodiesterase
MNFSSVFRWLMVLVSLCLGVVVNSMAQPSGSGTSTKPLVILVSLDGFKPSYLSATSTPNLLKLSQEGASTRGLISAFPSLTFPNHLTLVTGQTPDEHGIVNNTMTDPATPQRFSLGSRQAVENPLWWQDARPIWITLRQQ